MPLTDIARKEVEESILDAQTACQMHLTNADPPVDMIENVIKMLSVLEKYQDDLRNDDLCMNYKLHALVPLQTMYMILSEEDSE